MEKIKRKIVSFILMLTVILSFGGFNITAYGVIAPVTLEIPTMGILKGGEKVIAPIIIGNPHGIDFCHLKLLYDTDVYEDCEIMVGDMLSDVDELDKKLSYEVDKESGKITFIYNDDEELKKSGVWAYLRFTVKEDYNKEGSATLTKEDACFKGYDTEWWYQADITDKTTKVDESADKDKALVKFNVKEDGQTESSAINPVFTVTNISEKELDLTKLQFKYYYTKEGEEAEKFNCYYAGTIDGDYNQLTSYVEGKTEKDKDSDNSSITISFNGGTLDPGQSMEIYISVNKNDWSMYDKTNDLSYGDAKSLWSSLDNEEKIIVNKSDLINYIRIDSENQTILSYSDKKVEVPLSLKVNRDGPIPKEWRDDDYRTISSMDIKLKYNLDEIKPVCVQPAWGFEDAITSSIDEENGIINIHYDASKVEDKEAIEKEIFANLIVCEKNNDSIYYPEIDIQEGSNCVDNKGKESEIYGYIHIRC